jgi:tetratricopeptide (TPR) repeat protein
MRAFPIRVIAIGAVAAVGAALVVAGWFLFISSPATRALDEAAKALADRDFPTARRLLADHVRSHPRDGEALALDAQAARRAGELDDAANLIARAERYGAVAELVALERALAKVQTGETAQVGHYLEVAESHPTDPTSALLLEAIATGALQRLDLPVAQRAVELWERSADTSECRAVASEWRGEIAIRRGEVAAAADAYRRALELTPQSTPRRLRLAELLSRYAPAEALEQLEAAGPTATASPTAMLTRARCHRGLGDHDAALALLDKLLARRPDDYETLVERGQVLLELRRFDEAEATLQAAVEKYPQRREGLQTFARCLQLMGKTEAAKRMSERVAEIDRTLDERIRQLQERGKVSP